MFKYQLVHFLKPETEKLLSEINETLKKQLKIQERIYETKGKEIKLPQQDFYPQILAELKEIKSLLKQV